MASCASCHAPIPTFMLQQQFIKPHMRAKVVDWMMEMGASDECPLSRKALLLAVAYLDRYLGLTPDVKPDQLQLVAATAIWIAGKIEEDHFPWKSSDVTGWCGDAYTGEQVLEMEQRITQTLQWQLFSPTWMDLFFQLIERLSLQTRRSLTHKATSHCFQVFDLFVLNPTYARYAAESLVLATFLFFFPQASSELPALSTDIAEEINAFVAKYAALQVQKEVKFPHHVRQGHSEAFLPFFMNSF